MAAGATNRIVNVINLGRMGFLKAYDIQLRYARQHLDQLAGKPHAVGRDTLLLVEHNPVYTVGLRTDNYDAIEEQRLKKLGAEFYRTNRGGLITFHGPGQLVAYPILNLHHFQQGMKKYIATLEQTLINTCACFSIEARTTQDTGVWVGDSKIAAIGVHGSRFVTTHGIALNCNVDLTWFRHIVPCGIHDKGVTSVSKELSKPITIKKVIPSFLSAFQQEFGCELEFSMFDPADASLLNSEGEATEGSREGFPGVPSMQAAQGMRMMSTSAAQGLQRSSPRLAPMW